MRVNAVDTGVPGRRGVTSAVTVPELTYGELQAVLDGLGAAVGAAEAHGCLCGALCVRAGYAAPEWIGELIQAEDAAGLDGGSERVLEALHLETLETLRSEDFGFVPLVPGEGTPLADRVQALADWCGGFLYGMGAGGAGTRVAEVGDLGEILRDLGEIARARVDPEQAAEPAEEAYAELFEFVRAGVQLAFDELEATRSAQPLAGALVH